MNIGPPSPLMEGVMMRVKHKADIARDGRFKREWLFCP